MVLGSIASFVAVVAGIYRLAGLCFGPVVGLSPRCWCSAASSSRTSPPRAISTSPTRVDRLGGRARGAAPAPGHARLLLLAAAGLLRPDAWVLSGAYWLWCSWPADNRTRLRYLALAAHRARAVGRGRHRRHRRPSVLADCTAGLAQELERTQGFSSVLARVWSYGVRIDKLPVLLGGIVGVPLAVWLAPRRALAPLAALVLLTAVFVAEGAVGASVIDRYLLGAATMLLPFCAVSIGGWAMLAPGLGAAARVDRRGRRAGALRRGDVAKSFSLSSLRTTLAQHEDFHVGLAAGARRPRRQGPAAPLPAVVAARQQADPRRPLDPRHRRPARHRRAQRGARGRRQGRAHPRGSHPRRQRGRLPARQRRVRGGDRRRRRRPARPGPAGGLQTDLHEPYYAVYANC